MSDPPPTEFYREDLATIHDEGFSDYVRGAAPALLKRIKDAGFSSGTVADLGCGGGVWARELVDAGFKVFGVDVSEGMIEIARKRVPEATFVVGSFLDAPLPRCVAVTAVGEVLNYLFDQRNDERMLGRLFSKIHRALEPGGTLSFDVAHPGHAPKPGTLLRHVLRDDWAVLVTSSEDANSGILTRQITTFRKVGDAYRRDDETHRTRLYSGKRLAELLREAGFKAKVSRSYGAFRLPGARVALLATKPRARRHTTKHA